MTAIIIPVRTNTQQEKNLLRRALDSLVIQTNKKFFTIISHDFSELDIEDIIQDYSKKIHLIYIKKPTTRPIGASATRNLGIEKATQMNIDSVIFLDADDMLFPYAVDQLTYELNHTLADYIASYSVNNIGSLYNSSNNLTTWVHGKIYRLSFLNQNNIRFPEDVKTNEDLAFNLKVEGTSKKRYFLKNPVYFWTDNQLSTTRQKNNLDAKKVSGEDYIYAIYDATNYYINNNIPCNRLINSIISLYKYYENSKILGVGDLEKLKKICHELWDILKKQNLLTKSNILQYAEKQQTFLYFDKKIYPYKETFFQWLEEIQINLNDEGIINDSYSN